MHPDYEIIILNWDKFNPRKDVKNPSWFRLEHSLFEAPEFEHFDHSEMLTWIYILCLCSRKNTNCADLYLTHAVRVARLQPNKIITALEKLSDINKITYKRVTRSLRRRNARVTHACSTNETNETNETNAHPSAGRSAPALHAIALLWNELADQKLPRVLKTEGRRKNALEKAWKRNPSDEYWKSVIVKINSSEFLTGSKGFVAGIDWIVVTANLQKIMEGTYDNRAGENGIKSGSTFETLTEGVGDE